jgi:signal peptide peptidase SppA
LKVNHTLSAILNGVWLIEPSAAASYLPLVASIIKGDTLSFEKDDQSDNRAAAKASALASVAGATVYRKTRSWMSFNDAPKNSIAEIAISGPILKVGQCGDPGSSAFAEWIKEADQNPNISSILLRIDSPGGLVNGTATLADAIKNTSKKIIAYVDEGMAASAAYWLASACDEIVLSQKHDQVGSIGVYTTLHDVKGYYEKMGVNVLEIYASQSSDKNGLVKKAFEGDTKPLIEEHLNPLAETFINVVKANRSDKLNLSAGNPFTGKMYRADDAIAIGLADRVSNYEDLVLAMAETSTIQKSNSQNMAKGKWTAVATAVGVAAFESTEEGIHLNAEQMDSINAELDREVVDAATHQEAADSLSVLQTAQSGALVSLNEQLQAIGEEAATELGEGLTRLGALALDFGQASGANFTKAKPAGGAEEKGKASSADLINEEIARKSGIV